MTRHKPPFARAVQFGVALLLSTTLCKAGTGNPDAKPLQMYSEPAPMQAAARVNALRADALGLIEQSRQRAGMDFPTLVAKLDEKVRHGTSLPLPELPMPSGKKRGYEAWRLTGVSYRMLEMAVAYSLSESTHYENAQIADHFRQSVQTLLNHFTDEGTVNATDPNVDRFILTIFNDAIVLGWPMLTPELQAKCLSLIQRSAQHQLNTYGPALVAGYEAAYPNMDAAYLLILRQAGEIFDDELLRKESEQRVLLLGKLLQGSTYNYLGNWPSDPGYTNITLMHLGRYWQLSGDPQALSQIKAHTEYYRWFLEPDGQMDYGISPPIKHNWSVRPFAPANPALELVQVAAPSAFTLGRVKQFRNLLLHSNQRLIHALNFYWLADTEGEGMAMETNFLRPSQEAVGWQMRQTTAEGTWTAWLFGREIALDTRVSAIATPPPDERLPMDAVRAAGIAGVFLELFQNGQSFFTGELEPQIESSVDAAAGTVTMSITQSRKTFGGTLRPMLYGEKRGNGRTGSWAGGMADTLPVRTQETWTLGRGRLDGQIMVEVLQDVRLEDVSLTVAPILPQVDEKRVSGNRVLARYGTLCVEVQVLEGAWWPTPQSHDNQPNFHFRRDLPNGVYDVTLIAGDADFALAPMQVTANAESPPIVLSAPAGQFATGEMRVAVEDGSLRLHFNALPTEHWKVNAIKIVRAADGAPVALYDVGPATETPAKGYERLSGSMVYTPQAGFGWAEDLSAQERSRQSDNPLEQTLITSDSSGSKTIPELVIAITDDPLQASARMLTADTTLRAAIRIRQAETLEAFMAIEKQDR